jgi:hypothetical protein
MEATAMFSAMLLVSLCSTEAIGHGHKKDYPPPVFDGGGDPGYHGCGGWGRPYCGYGWTGYYCPEFRHIHLESTLPVEPLIVPPPGAYSPDIDEEKDKKDKNDKDRPAGAAKAGLVVLDPTPDLLRALGYERDAEGVPVLAVAPKGLAAGAGLKPGMVILTINGKPVRSARTVDSAIGERKIVEGIELEVSDPKGKKQTLTLK